MLWPGLVVLGTLLLWPCRLGFFTPNFDLILLTLAFVMLDPFCSASMMEMLVLSFFVSSSILSLHVFLGRGPTRCLVFLSTTSVMVHAVAYNRLLISVMLRACPCLMLVRAKFARFRVSATWLLIAIFGTGFLFCIAVTLVISHFCLMRFSTSAIFSSSGVCWAASLSWPIRLPV